MYLIAGATGYIGSAVLDYFIRNNIPCVGIGKKNIIAKNYICCDMLDIINLKEVLRGITIVINCVGYAHDMNDLSIEYKNKVWIGNFQITKNLLDASVEVGVKRFINLSSVKAMKDPGNYCANEEWELNPSSEYGRAKLAADTLCTSLMASTSLKIVILRLTMVYGPNAKGNFGRLVKLISMHLFPPIPQTNNRRSIIHINDVVDAINAVISNPISDNQSFIITGPDSPSGRDMYDEIRRALGYKYVSFFIPRIFFVFLATLLDYIQLIIKIKMPFSRKILSQLLDSACYSSKKIEKQIGWKARVRFRDGLKKSLIKI